VARVRKGTTKILLVDFLVAMGVMTFGLLYAKISPIYLVLLSSITFVLFFIVSILLVDSDRYVAKGRRIPPISAAMT